MSDIEDALHTRIANLERELAGAREDLATSEAEVQRLRAANETLCNECDRIARGAREGEASAVRDRLSEKLRSDREKRRRGND